MASIHKEPLKRGGTSYCVRWTDPMTGKPRNRRFRNAQDAKDFRSDVESAIRRAAPSYGSG